MECVGGVKCGVRGVCRVWSVRVCVWGGGWSEGVGGGGCSECGVCGGGGVRVWGGCSECGVWSVWVCGVRVCGGCVCGGVE